LAVVGVGAVVVVAIPQVLATEVEVTQRLRATAFGGGLAEPLAESVERVVDAGVTRRGRRIEQVELSGLDHPAHAHPQEAHRRPAPRVVEELDGRSGQLDIAVLWGGPRRLPAV